MVVICPICKQKVPFGMQLHMLAVHGPNSAKYQLRAAQWQKGMSPKGGKRSKAKGRGPKSAGKKPLKNPRHSKRS
jgi:hypothetical protein